MALILRSVLSSSNATVRLAAKACTAVHANAQTLGMMRGTTTSTPFFSRNNYNQYGAANHFSTATGMTATNTTTTMIRGAVSDGVSSPMEIRQKTPGSVTNRLRILDVATVHKIQEELRSVDVNADGVIDSEELKELLRKHKNAFTDEEIVIIGEMFYAGRSGAGVPIERFIEALDQVMAEQTNDTTITHHDDDHKNPLNIGRCGNEYLFFNSHSNYTKEDLVGVKMTHTEPETWSDRLAFNAVKLVRFFFDKATGWTSDKASITPERILNRTIYLETIAAVPGMVAAIVRHFRSLRTMQRDGGMLQMFLDEANNERMHLLTFVRMKNPGPFFRAAVIGGQFVFGTLFGTAYIISPKFCHRFVGYIEEEAVTTYTKIIDAIETAPADNALAQWQTQVAPRIARSYWKLGVDGTVLDLMYAVRADEAEHRDVNHQCSELKDGAPNPVSNTEQKLNTMLVKYIQDMMERDGNAPLRIITKTAAAASA